MSTGFNATVSGVTTAQMATITAQANGISTTFNITLSPGTVLSASATSLPFGNVPVGSVVTKSLTLTSTGTAAITINSISASGAGFSVLGGSFPITLNPGQATVVTVQFDPTTAASVTGQLSISSNAPATTVSLSGTGVLPTVNAVSCSSTSITGSLTDACTVSLSGPAPAGGMSVALASSSSAVTVPSSVTVPANATSAAFAANVACVSSAQSVTVTATAGTTSKTVSLQLNASTPALNLSATSLSFGNVSVGTAVTNSVTVTSSGTAPVTINSDSASGTGFSVLGGSFPLTLNPGQATVVTVQFDPTTAGSVTGQLTISSNAPTATVSLSGTGTAVSPTVSAVSCNSTSITGSLADTCTVTLSGSAPTGGVIVNLASSSGAVTVPGSVTVPATATSTKFTANVASVSSTQSVTLTASTGSTSKSTSLQLNAATPGLTLSTTSIGFGSVIVNTPVSQPITLNSTGTAPVTLNSATVSGSGFSIAGATFPTTLNPGQSLTLEVQFDPATVGSFSGQLTVASSASSSPVAITGTGAPHEVNLAWSSPTGSSDPVVGYKIYRAVSGTTSYQCLNAAVDTVTAYGDTTVQPGTSYAYYVTSVDAEGVESAPSNTTTVAVP